jgi:ClpP class serine protease
MTNKSNAAFQRIIEPLLSSGYLAAHEQWLFKAMADFEADFAILQMGGTIDLSERRKAQRPSFYAAADISQTESQTAETQTAGGIAIIPLRGVMRMESSPSTLGAMDIAEYIRMADADPNVSAIMLDIYSGGGEADAGFLLNQTLLDASKPTVAYSQFAASAAYLYGIGADEIYGATTSAQFGSIGVYSLIDNEAVKELRERYSFVYSEGADKKNAAQRAMIEGDNSLLKAEINAISDKFQEKVKNRREIKMRAADVFAGAMFDAQTAKRIGMIDGITSYNAALSRAMYLAGRGKKKKM